MVSTTFEGTDKTVFRDWFWEYFVLTREALPIPGLVTDYTLPMASCLKCGALVMGDGTIDNIEMLNVHRNYHDEQDGV